jgi:hypothetical protein
MGWVSQLYSGRGTLSGSTRATQLACGASPRDRAEPPFGAEFLDGAMSSDGAE